MTRPTTPTSNGGVRITPAEATKNPTPAQWLYCVIANECWNMPNEIHSYTELQQQIHDDLRNQHPEWVQPNGNCPTCDSYELRLAELLGLDQRSSIVSNSLPRLHYAGA